MGREIAWPINGVVELNDNEWELIHSATVYGKKLNRTFWRGQFGGDLPRLVPLKGKTSDKEDKEEV